MNAYGFVFGLVMLIGVIILSVQTIDRKLINDYIAAGFVRWLYDRWSSIHCVDKMNEGH